jgi:hypothetical protein
MNNFEFTLEQLNEGQDKKGKLVKEYKGLEIHKVEQVQQHPNDYKTPFYVYETKYGYSILMFTAETLKDAVKKTDDWMVQRESDRKAKTEREAQEKIERDNRIANREKDGMGSIGVRDSGVNRWGQGRNAVRGSGNGGSGLMWK